MLELLELLLEIQSARLAGGDRRQKAVGSASFRIMMSSPLGISALASEIGASRN
ncbi:hypothetical protein AAFG07_31440 [Bradyrhizobium sp. B097]|uniref:hypothetical protein n=1 Tax=Bradyrhizobium sp. B097 TaxID=3140244 RepID=UPI003182BF48